MEATHPAWGVALMAASGAVIVLVNLAALAVRGGPLPLLLGGAATTVGAAVCFIRLALHRADRWQGWMTHAGMVTGEANLAVLVSLAPDPVTAAGLASSFCLAAVYAGLYLGWRAVVGHVLLLVCVSSLAVGRSGGSASTAVLLTVAPTCVVLSFLSYQLANLLRRQSETDPLTGLLNRRGLYRLAGALHRRDSRTWSVAVLDLDGFKAVNDAHGHDVGDELLRSVASAWSSVLPDQVLLGRTGGDEFVCLVPATLARTLDVVEELRAATPPPVGLSAGVARWGRLVGLDEALRCADSALYVAKHDGKGRTAVGPSDEGDDPGHVLT